MGLFGSLFGRQDSQRWNEHADDTEYEPEQHQSPWTHEAIASAAGFDAMKAYESHLRTTGEEPSHLLMKEMLASFAAVEVDKLVETKGLDYIDREGAKRRAIEQAHHLADERYGAGGNGVEYARNQSQLAHSAPADGCPPEDQYSQGRYDGQGEHAPPTPYGQEGFAAQPGYRQGNFSAPPYPFVGAPMPSDCGGCAGSGYGAAPGGPEGVPHYHISPFA